MSLVNNMLRDLDQRRKDSESGGSAIKLMPASDFVGEDKSGLVQLVLIGLALLTAGLTYYWYSLSQDSSEQQLGIQVGGQVSASSVAPEQLIQELEADIASNELAATQPQPATVDTAADSAAEQLGSTAVAVEQAVVAEAETSTIVPQQAASLPVEPATLNQNQNQSVAAGPELVRGGPIESVKEAPRFTNEQLDTMAVQEALKLIASGQPEEAYDTLTEFITGNRYAHQSRETYAKLLMSQGRVLDANALIDGGLAIAPNHAGFKKVKARLLMTTGEIGGAVDILISRAPDVAADPEYHDLLATAQLSSRDFSGAVISYRGLVQHDQSQGKWWYGFAAAHDQLGNAAEARQAYGRAITYANLSANLRRRSQERLGILNAQ